MKKQVLFIVLIAALAVISLIRIKNSTPFLRHRYEAFLREKGLESTGRRVNMGDEKMDNPEMAELQNLFQTMDPQTRTIPRERLGSAILSMKAAQSLKAGSTDLQWTSVPAEMGGRTRTLMFDPNDATHKKVWAGGVTGGLWYNNDITSAGSSWIPVGDIWGSLAVHCITWDPTNPQVFYAGTGEPETAMQTYRESSGLGDGIWKSTNGGQTWSQLPSTVNFAFVSKIIVKNESGNGVIYAGVVSGLYHGSHQSQPSNGLFRSTDGGTTWQQVLPDIQGQSFPYSPSDVVLSPTGRIFVGTMPDLQGQGAASILYSDAGTSGSWNVNTSFQSAILVDTAKRIPGRVVFGCAQSDPNVIYAMIAQGFYNAFNGFNYYYCYRIYRSADNGVNWIRKNIPTDASGQPNFAYLAWHALDVTVDPNNEDNVFVGGLDIHKSTDGGNSWTKVSDWTQMYYGGGDTYVHGDQHTMVFQPGSSDKMIMGTDGGVFYTASATASAPVFEQRNINFNTLQFYTAAIKPVSGYEEYLGGLQDNGTVRFTGWPLTIMDLATGGDGAFCFYDQDEPDYSLTSIYYNQWAVFDGQMIQNYITDFYQSGVFVNPADYDYRNNTLYSNVCDFAGNYFDNILRINDIMSFGYSGSFVPVNTGSMVYYSAVKWSPYSPTDNTVLFLGSASGKMFRIDHAESSPSATDITGSNFPVGSLISIDVHGSNDTLLATFSNYGVTSVFLTVNGGQTWKSREGNLPDMPVRWGIFHPDNGNQVMLATETGIWTTANFYSDNVTWKPDISGMANVRVDQLSMRSADNTVLAASHGRGLFTTTWDVISGIEQPVMAGFSIYPNPASESLNISLPSGQKGEVAFSVYDQSGRMIMESTTNPGNPGGVVRISLNGMHAGVYYVSLRAGTTTLRTTKFVKN